MILIALFAFASNWIAWKKGFYTLPESNRKKAVFLTLKHVIAFFLIFISTAFFIPAFISIFPPIKALPEMEALAWKQGVTMSVALLLLYLYAHSLDLRGMGQIWREKSSSIHKELGIGILSWLLIFPVITLIGELFTLLSERLFGPQAYEQIAIRFLKMAMGHLPLLIVALTSIVIIAPIIEEFLFRGILQIWLQKNLGRWGGITVSSLFFAAFHLSPSQKAGNIPLFFALFTFACFLGFLYEKRRSLFAPIGLHMAYNLLSSLRVIFGDIT